MEKVFRFWMYKEIVANEMIIHTTFFALSQDFSYLYRLLF